MYTWAVVRLFEPNFWGCIHCTQCMPAGAQLPGNASSWLCAGVGKAFFPLQ
jgi:hypothetical protein